MAHTLLRNINIESSRWPWRR